MKPVMFCRNRIGTLRWSHSSMKCAPLSEDSENSTPLLARMPTGRPWIWAKPHDQRGAVERLEFVEFAAVDQARDDLALVERPRQVGADDAGNFGGIEQRRARRRGCRHGRAARG